MKLDCIRDNGAVVHVHPHAALEQIREAIRPGMVRSQRRWKRKATLRKWALRAESVLIVTCGVLGTALASYWVASEAYLLVAYFAGRMR